MAFEKLFQVSKSCIIGLIVMPWIRVILTWMRDRWMPNLSVSPARCKGSSATFWSAYLRRMRWLGVRAVRAAGCPGAPCGETGVRAPGWTARSARSGRRWAPQTLPACRRSGPGERAFWGRRCWMDFRAFFIIFFKFPCHDCFSCLLSLDHALDLCLKVDYNL